MMNSLSEEKSLPQKISEDIIALILEENLQPGDKLPNETILSERLNAGRSSVREAMKLLASRNIVTIRQGSGTYISSSPGMVDDPLGFTFIGNKQKLITDLLEVRFLLEPSIAAMAATRADKKDIKKITALCDEVEELLRKHEDLSSPDTVTDLTIVPGDYGVGEATLTFRAPTKAINGQTLSSISKIEVRRRLRDLDQ